MQEVICRPGTNAECYRAADEAAADDKHDEFHESFFRVLGAVRVGVGSVTVSRYWLATLSRLVGPVELPPVSVSMMTLP